MSTNPFVKIVYRTNSAMEANKPAKTHHHSSTKTNASSSNKKIASAQKWANASNIMTTVLGTGMSVFQLTSSLKQASKVMNGQNPYDNKNSAVITEVSTAQSATAEIEKAIENYRKNGDVEGLKSYLSQEPQCQAQATAIENMVKDAETKVSEQTKNLTQETTKNEDYKKAVDTAKEAENTAEESYNAAVKAENNYNAANVAYTTASTTYNSLNTAYEAMPDTIPAPPTGSVPNPAKPALKIKVDAAKLEMETKKRELDAAQEAYNKTGTSTSAKQAWDKKKADRASAENTLEESDKKVKSLKNDLAAAKTELATAKKNQIIARTANAKWAKAIEKAKAELSSGGYINNDNKSNKLDTKGLYDYTAPKSSKNTPFGLGMDESIFRA